MTDINNKNNICDSQRRVLALGYFDGMHLGHRAVVENALAFADRGFIPSILLLEPHPQKLLKNDAPGSLFFGREKERVLNSFGAEILALDFAEIMNYSAECFFSEILLGRLNAGALCCGEDYRFGSGGKGNAELLSKMCRENSVELSVCKTVFCGGEQISSTAIRNYIRSGEIEAANRMLGREFAYECEVVHGDNVGRRLLGVPTINQLFPADFTVPCFGVYRSRTKVGGKWYDSVTNIGRKPTFGESELRSETHILGFDGDLYGEFIEVRLVSFVRPERRFSDMDELKRQLKVDMELYA